MARWRLSEPHYIYTDPDTVWERIETDTTTGRQVRKQYVVPAYFHHEIESDWTDKVERAVIVSNKFDPVHKTDIVFRGEPTPGMRPLDPEAEAISAQYKDKWNIPDHIKWGDGQYSSALADHFAEQMDRVNTRANELAERNASDLNKYMENAGIQQAQMIKILEMLVTKFASAEQVVDDMEPLPPSGEVNVAQRPSPPDNRRPASVSAGARRRF